MSSLNLTPYDIYIRSKERKRILISNDELKRLIYILPISFILLLTYNGYISSACLLIYWFISAIHRTKLQIASEDKLDELLNPKAFQMYDIIYKNGVDLNNYLIAQEFHRDYECIIRNLKYIDMNPKVSLSENEIKTIMAPYNDQLKYFDINNLCETDRILLRMGYVKKSKMWDDAPPAAKVSNYLEIKAYCDNNNGYKPKRKDYYGK